MDETTDLFNVLANGSRREDDNFGLQIITLW